MTSSTQIKAELAKRSLYNFLQYTWYKKTIPFKTSWHIKEICEKIDNAIEKYRQGQSSYIIITMPPRHSKSQIVSISLPVYFKGMFQESEIMVTSYAANLLTKFSRDARDKVVQGDVFKEMYLELSISKKSASVTDWGFEKTIDGITETLEGNFQYSGILGGLGGKGYHLGIGDDLIKGREEAESEIIRDKVWDEIIDSFLTRAAPVSITILMHTRWHMDDPIGRIQNRMNPNHEDYDETFPLFEIINYPAEDEEYRTKEGNNDSKYLFSNRYSDDYYAARKGTMTDYSYSALMMCDPVLKGGNIFKVDNIEYIDEIELPPNLKWVRAWDLASSEKERINNDPDWTRGVLMSVTTEYLNKFPLRKIYIKHLESCRAEAPHRDAIILSVVNKDGENVKIAIESFGAYKDAYVTLKNLLLGIRIVYKITTSGDKVVRATPQETIIEARNFFIVRGDWNKEFIKEYTNFPAGSHDDIVDAVSTGYHCITKIAIIK